MHKSASLLQAIILTRKNLLGTKSPPQFAPPSGTKKKKFYNSATRGILELQALHRNLPLVDLLSKKSIHFKMPQWLDEIILKRLIVHLWRCVVCPNQSKPKILLNVVTKAAFTSAIFLRKRRRQRQVFSPWALCR
jgi:hypothetical protein